MNRDDASDIFSGQATGFGTPEQRKRWYRTDHTVIELITGGIDFDPDQQRTEAEYTERCHNGTAHPGDQPLHPHHQRVLWLENSDHYGDEVMGPIPSSLSNWCETHPDTEYIYFESDEEFWAQPHETPQEEYDRIAAYRNRPTRADLYVCTDLFEGYDPSEDIPF